MDNVGKENTPSYDTRQYDGAPTYYDVSQHCLIWHKRYDDMVRAKFPCPEGYEELTNEVDVPVVVYDRITKAKYIVRGPDPYPWLLELEPGGHIVNRCWYVMK